MLPQSVVLVIAMHETFRKKTPVQEQPANDWSAWDKWCDARIEK
jgi:hypothetical protein